MFETERGTVNNYNRHEQGLSTAHGDIQSPSEALTISWGKESHLFFPGNLQSEDAHKWTPCRGKYAKELPCYQKQPKSHHATQHRKSVTGESEDGLRSRTCSGQVNCLSRCLCPKLTWGEFHLTNIWMCALCQMVGKTLLSVDNEMGGHSGHVFTNSQVPRFYCLFFSHNYPVIEESWQSLELIL